MYVNAWIFYVYGSINMERNMVFLWCMCGFMDLLWCVDAWMIKGLCGCIKLRICAMGNMFLTAYTYSWRLKNVKNNLYFPVVCYPVKENILDRYHRGKMFWHDIRDVDHRQGIYSLTSNRWANGISATLTPCVLLPDGDVPYPGSGHACMQSWTGNLAQPLALL